MPKLFRFIISGGTATATGLLLAYVFTEWLGVWYVVSATVAFLVSVSISFGLQKLWTFGNNSVANIRQQITLFVVVSLGGVIFNDVFIYVLVEFAHAHYLLAQIISGIVIASVNFFLYRRLFYADATIRLN